MLSQLPYIKIKMFKFLPFIHNSKCLQSYKIAILKTLMSMSKYFFFHAVFYRQLSEIKHLQTMYFATVVDEQIKISTFPQRQNALFDFSRSLGNKSTLPRRLMCSTLSVHRLAIKKKNLPTQGKYAPKEDTCN